MNLNEATIKKLNAYKKRLGVKRKNTIPPAEKQRLEIEKTFAELQVLREKLPAQFTQAEAEKILQLKKSNAYRKLKLMEVCGLIKLIKKNPLTYIQGDNNDTI